MSLVLLTGSRLSCCVMFIRWVRISVSDARCDGTTQLTTKHRAERSVLFQPVKSITLTGVTSWTKRPSGRYNPMKPHPRSHRTSHASPVPHV